MPVVKKLTRIGNSTGVILPQTVLEQMGVDQDSEVELEIKGKTLLVKPHQYASDQQFQTAKRKVFSKHRRALERLAR